ncbi:MAG: MOSC N-terminal beta barrel domain-containing protein [Acidimicrobiales bacterium]|nr:MOSC N-terminal beta barrel domain-containing protein [Acidimicrobiales bacterium]
MSDATVVGRVARLARYPVKSFQGEVLDRATFGGAGLVGDRVLGVVDAESGHVLSAKSVPELLDAEARTTPSGIEVRLPGGEWLAAPSAAAGNAVSAWLGRPVRVEPAPPGESRNYAMSFNIDDESLDTFEWFCPPGTFYDLADVHVLTTASLRAAAGRHPEGAWAVERFRPTVLVDVEGDDFVEDAWVGHRLRFGSAAEVVVDQPTIRCPMTTRPQGGLPRDLDILRTVNRDHGGNLGLYASIAAAGEVAVGDEVVLLPS